MRQRHTIKEQSETLSSSHYLPSQISEAHIEFMLFAALFGIYAGTVCIEQEEG